MFSIAIFLPVENTTVTFRLVNVISVGSIKLKADVKAGRADYLFSKSPQPAKADEPTLEAN
jgi:hypothetical protein